MPDKMTPETAADLIATALAAFADSYWVAMETEYVPSQHDDAVDIQDFVNILTDMASFNTILENLQDNDYSGFDLSWEQDDAIKLYLDWTSDVVDDEWRDKVYEIAVNHSTLVAQIKWLVENTQRTIAHLETALRDMRDFLRRH
jgi:hypothetical protein